jgi:tetratricopeptide (TPR) repeat protein
VSALERNGAYERSIEASRTLLVSGDLTKNQRIETLNLLGLSEDDEGNLSQSLQAYKGALDIFAPGENTDRVRGATLNNLGRLYLETGQLSISFKLRLRALELYKRANDHAGQAIAENNLAALAFLQGRVAEGGLYLKEATHEASTAKDLDALDRAAILSTQAWAEALKGDFAGAVAADTQALHIASRAYSDSNPTVGWQEIVLASAYDLNGQHDQAMRLCQEGLSSLKQSLGSSDSRYLAAQLSYSTILDHVGAHEQALRLSREAQQKQRMLPPATYRLQAIGLDSGGAQ